MHPDAARWNRKYREREGEREFRVERRLESVAGLLGAPGRALDIASGAGASALWLAGRGWRTWCVDVSVEGLRIACAEACRRGVRLQGVVADSGSLPLAPGPHFDLITVMRYLDRDLFAWVAGALAPGGQVFFCTFNRGHLDAHPRFDPRYVLEPGELGRAFPGMQRQAGEDEATTSWILARKP